MKDSATRRRQAATPVMVLGMTRRRLIASGALAGIMAPTGLEAHFWIPKINGRQDVELVGWWTAFTAGAAAGLLVEVVKNFGFISSARAAVSPTVADQHAQEARAQNSQGYDVNREYTGAYSGGDIALSGARRGNSYIAFGTANHDLRQRTCTLVYSSPDLFALKGLSIALRNKGVPTHAMQSKALPVHGNKVGTYDNYGHTAWREAMTPNDGTVRWMARESKGRPTAVAEVNSPGLRANVQYTG